MPSAQTLYNSQAGLNTNVLVLSTLTTPITSSAVSAVQFINAQDVGSQGPPLAPYQFAYQISASGGLGSPTAQAYLLTSYDGGTTWIPCAQGTEISPGQDIVESVAVQSMGSLVAVAWMLNGTPAPSVTGRAWLISTEVFSGTVRTDLTATTTYATPAASTTDASEAWVTLQLQELTWKAPVVVATVQALNAYTRTDNVITANANGALPTIDGVSLAVADRLLLKDGAAGADNGIYVVTSLGSAGTPFVLTRADDMNTSAKVETNIAVLVNQGTTNTGMLFRLITTGAIDLNTTALTFSGQLRSEAPTEQSSVVNLATFQTLTWKIPVRTVTTTTLPAYTRVGNVITENANGALPAIDGVSLAVADRLLLKDGAAGADNGIYVVTDLGSAGTPFVLTRATDMDSSQKVRTNVAVMADQGTTQGGFRFLLTTTGAIILNTTALTFSAQIKAPNASADADVVNLGLFQAQWAKAPVRASTTAAAGLPAYTRVSNVLTANANGALPAIDGVSLAVGERVLVRNGAAGADNGIYVVTSLGSAGTTWVLTRADDYSASADVRAGDLVAVQEGTVWQGALFQQVTTGTITLNTSTLTFTKVGGVTPAEFETSSSPYTIGLDEELLLVDSTAGNITVNLPPIATRRRRPVTVANIAAANNAVVTPNGAETVMGGATRNVGARTSITLMGPRSGNDWVNVG